MLLFVIATLLGADEAVQEDPRAEVLRDTKTSYTMTPFESREDWEAYAADLRRIIRVSCGMYPEAARPPVEARRETVATHEDYSVERVEFEAVPGLFVTGNLYLPVGEGPFPAVICPHGHWKEGRLEDSDACSVPARCITFARMGMIAFAWDMAGYNDSHPMTHAWAHSPESLPLRERRIEAIWGFHPFSVQLVSAVRALDFIAELPTTDVSRIACVGASGGGTQTFALAAIDQRVAVPVPVNMVSHSMQGGCMCENAPLIRLHASNMEIAALAAPRPMTMIWNTGDWTSKTLSVEYPAVRGIYALHNAADRLEQHGVEAGHNFNLESREAVYAFLAKHLLGRETGSFAESPYTMEPAEALRVYPDGPPQTEDAFAALLAWWREDAAARARAVLPSEPEGLASFTAAMRPALRDCIGLSAANATAPVTARREPADLEGLTGERVTLAREGVPGSVEGWLLHPVPLNGTPRGVALLLHDDGARAVTDANGALRPLAERLLAEGIAVMALSPFPGELAERRPDRPFRDTFEPSDTGWRVQDVLTALVHLRATWNAGELRLFGTGNAGVVALLASAADGDVGCTVTDLVDFNPDSDDHWVDRAYLPSIRALGGIEAATAMIAPGTLVLAMEDVATGTATSRMRRLVRLFPPGVIEIVPAMADPAGWADALVRGAHDAAG
jgi:hypothetical protein